MTASDYIPVVYNLLVSLSYYIFKRSVKHSWNPFTMISTKSIVINSFMMFFYKIFLKLCNIPYYISIHFLRLFSDNTVL